VIIKIINYQRAIASVGFAPACANKKLVKHLNYLWINDDKSVQFNSYKGRLNTENVKLFIEIKFLISNSQHFILKPNFHSF